MSYIPTDCEMSLYSEMYKSAFGVRPRHEMIFHSGEDFINNIKQLQNEISRQMQEEDEREKEALMQFEKTVSEVMITCKCNWKKAVQILMDAEKDIYARNDIEYFLFEYGIHGYLMNDVKKRFLS